MRAKNEVRKSTAGKRMFIPIIIAHLIIIVIAVSHHKNSWQNCNN